MGFHHYIGERDRSEYVKNCSYRLEGFVNNSVANFWKIFSFENDVFVRTYVKGTANSLQTSPS